MVWGDYYRLKSTNESINNSKCRNEEVHGKMPVFCCSCGVKILVLPDLSAMKKAIKNHIIEHKKLGGQILTEENLTHQVLEVVIDAINKI